MNKRVVVTGIGVINPSGIGKDKFWQNMTEGKSAIKEIDRFDTTGFPTKVAGVKSIQQGHNDVVLTGGSEAPREKLDKVGQSSLYLGLETLNPSVLEAKRATC